MFIIPLSHESGEVQRLPYISIGIIILNVLLYIITAFTTPDSGQSSSEQESKLIRYILAHPDMDIPEETLRKLPAGPQSLIRQMKEGKSLTNPGAELDPGSEEPESPRTESAELKELDTYIAALGQADSEDFYKKYGYIPSQGRVFTLFSSMFIHAGIFHLLFNMFFLYLTGCKLEDLWGRIVYPIFYLLGGIAATLTHTLMFPQSQIPLVGASGAVAALMGAFMIRLYKTRIYFFYLLIMGFKPRRGTFMAPAYLMIPLWLLQQIWEALTSGNTGGGVAFWAHIGGFMFGAAVAALFKFTRFEEKFIAPAIERKTNLVDEFFSSGSKKLRENDVDGAVADLRKAARNDPDNAVIRIELSKAYHRQGKSKEAFSEFHRAMSLYIKQDDMESAVNDYLEMHSKFPQTMPETHTQTMTIIAEMEKREMYAEAATAYKNFSDHCQNSPETKECPESITALIRYGDICMTRLQQPKSAFKAYKTLLDVSNYLSNELQEELKSKAKEAVRAAQDETRKAVIVPKKEDIGKEEEIKTADSKPIETPKTENKVSEVPLGKRIKLAEPADTPKYKINTVAAFEANKVSGADAGLNLHRPSEPPVLFALIYFICVFELEQENQRKICADIFIAGKPRPYRIPASRVAFSEFLSSPSSNSIDNFRKFIIHIISQLSSVYIDKKTAEFLKTKKVQSFSSPNDVEIYEKKLWQQLIGELRSSCEKCGETYWVDSRKIPETGAKAKCKKCGEPVLFRRVT